jgi:excisionase family DNA binding protein
MEKDLKTLREMAKTLGIHPATLRAYARSGTIKYYRIGKKYFFKESELLKDAAAQAVNKEEVENLHKICSQHNGICISNGYIHVRIGTHPMANKNGYAPLHRILMQAKIGRPLEPDEIVHQKNGNTFDNRLDNLEIIKTLGKHNQEKRFQREDRMPT